MTYASNWPYGVGCPPAGPGYYPWRQLLDSEMKRSCPQMPIGLSSGTVRPGRRGELRTTCHMSTVPTDLVCAAHRARRRRVSEPTLEARMVRGVYVVDFPEDKLPPPEAEVRAGERLHVAFLIEKITIGRQSILGGTRYLADTFYSDCDHPPLKTAHLAPGEDIVITVKNIGRVGAVLLATLWGIEAPCPPVCPQNFEACR